MNINKLLDGKYDCKCGETHTCEIKHISVKSNAISDLGQFVKDYSKILLVADCNTYKTCSEKVLKILGEKLQNKVVFEFEGFLIPNEEATKRISDAALNDTELIIGIGSGVINDLCKYVSFIKELPYYIIATAPSMDGYASNGAAMIMGNMKVTYNARVPQVIIADTDIIKDAPIEMIQAGFGDIIGKLSCLNDWKLAASVNGEYFCQYVYDLTMEMVDAVKDDGALLQNRDEGAITRLMEALLGVGIAMAYVGNSRPASGSEHHFSHYFEITGILNNRDYFCHGTDVAYSTVQTALMREKILQFEEYPENTTEFDREEWIKNIQRIYKTAATGVIELQDKCGYYAKDYDSVYKEKWQEIRKILSETPKASKLKELLESVGLDFKKFNDFYGSTVINDGVFYAKDLKDRYTFLWVYFNLFK